MRKLLLAVVANVMLLPLAYGQRTFSKPAADTTRISKETVVIITEENAGNYFETKKALNFTTLLKVNPLLLINGDLPIYIEQKLGNKLSVEVAGGVTYKNYVADIFDEAFYEFEYNQIKRTNEMGYSFSGALHFYPSKRDNIFEGLYFGPEMRYRNYKFQVTEVDDMKVDVTQNKIVTDFKLSVGSIRYFDDNIFVETYCGIGVRSKNYSNLLKTEVVYDPETGYEKEQVTKYNDTRYGPVLSAGFKFGYAF